MPPIIPQGQFQGLNAPTIQAPSNPGLFRQEKSFVGPLTEAAFNAGVAQRRADDIEMVVGANAAWKLFEAEKLREIRKRRLANADGSFGEVIQWWDVRGNVEGVEQTEAGKNFQAIYDSLDDPIKKTVDDMRAKRMPAFFNAVGSHEDNQALASAEATYKASTQNSITYATENHTDPDIIKQEMDDVLDSVDDTGDALGWDAERRQFEKDQKLSTLFLGVLQAKLNNRNPKRVDDARVFYETVKDKINVNQRSGMEKMIRDQDFLVTAQTNVDSIMQLPRGRQRAAVLKISNPEMRHKVRIGVDSRIRANKADHKDQQNELIDASLDIINRHDFNKGDPIAQIPPEVWSGMDVESQNKVIKVAEARGKPLSEEEDLDAYAEVHEILRRSERAFLNINIRGDYGHRLSSRHQAELIKKQGSIRRKEKSGGGSTMTFNAIRTHQINRMGIGDPEDRVFAGRAIEMVESQVENEVERGQKVDEKRYREIWKDVQKEMRAELSRYRLQKNQREQPKDTFGFATQINALFDQHGIKDKQEQGAIEVAVQRDIASLETTRKLRDEERAEVMETVLEDKVFISRFFNDTEKIAATLTEEQKTDAYVPVGDEDIFLNDLKNLDRQIKRRIKNELNAAGKRSTWQNIGAMWVSLGKPVSKDAHRSTPVPFVSPETSLKSIFGGGNGVASPEEIKRELSGRTKKEILAVKDALIKKHGNGAAEIINDALKQAR